MNLMERAEALALRLRTEPPSDELRDAVLMACGWERDDPLFGTCTDGWRFKGGGLLDVTPEPLKDWGTARSLFPDEWQVSQGFDAGRFICTASRAMVRGIATGIGNTRCSAYCAAAVLAHAMDAERRV